MARAEIAAFSLKLSPLSPFIVGSGRRLGRFDYTLTINPRSGAPLIRVLDTERFIAESPLPPEKKIEAIEKRQAATLDRFSLYVLACGFREAREGLELVEFHRDGLGRPQVPASSLRGMLRTAVLHAALTKNRALLQEGVAGALEGRWRRERAADRLERRVLGGSRVEDPLRRLRVGEPAPLSHEDLKAYEVAVMNLQGGPPRPKLTLHVEALNPRAAVTIDFPIALERPLEAAVSPGSPAAAPAALLAGPEKLLGALRGFSEALIEGERRFYADSGARDLRRLFDETLRRAEGRIALPLGFGAGWRAKTLGVLLGPQELGRLAPLLSPGRSYYRHAGVPVFPKTRRWVLDGGRPAEPLGWTAMG